MSFLARLLVLLAAIGLGILIERFTERIVNFVGYSGWAEEKLGVGGTYTMWKLIGLIVIIGGLLNFTLNK